MTEAELRPALEEMSFGQLLEYCDSFELAHPATKQEAINLLLGNCLGCMLNKLQRNSNFVVKYLNIRPEIARSVVVTQSKPCLGCNK